MEKTMNIILKLKFLNARGNFHKEFLVHKDIFEQYVKAYIEMFASKNDEYYYISSISNTIIYKVRVGKDIVDNAKNVNFAMDLQKSILALNRELYATGFSRLIWMALDEYIMKNYEEDIKEEIKKIHPIIDKSGIDMRYKLLKVVTKTVETKHGKQGTPVVGYILKDFATDTTEFLERKEAYDKVKTYGATNVEALSRNASCEEDSPDSEGKIYYLKPNDGTKVNEHFISLEEYEKKELLSF
ncbi:hypothetical protein [Bacillus thuringiensis]|uniref:hypothetical protein n=1 Tax=Bacillus thuringiensis TaxID=1428 RepID=UPI0021D64876|nr:hypothetical protein [Bacillus thuringiensis]MCU7667880.1 hypothetical protein [Bacillus thuringiensis]